MNQIEWNFDRLDTIGGAPTEVEGHPEIISTAAGKAVAFNGVDDALFIAQHPLAGAATFTIEAVFRPDGGAFEQRWLHLAEADPVNGEAQSPRTLFEVRIVEDKWYSDAFTTGPGYNKALVVPEKTFPVARWYAVQQTLEGKMYRSYVDGVLQAEAEIDFKPHGPGRTSIGTRINRVTPFKGAVLEVRFTARALAPAAFAGLPSALKS
jgi:hypothetical protein